MAVEIRRFEVLTPTGIAKASPLITNLTMPVRTVEKVGIRIPPGPNGVLGFALGAAGQAFLPVNAGAFIVANDEEIDWPLDEQITSGAWQAMTYNIGQYPHTIYITFSLSLIRDPAAITPPAPTLTDLSNLPAQSASDTATAQASLDDLLAQLDVQSATP